MKWKPVNAYCIKSGEYRITKYTLGGKDLYVVYHISDEIGHADDGNAARKIASRHAERTSAC